MRMWTIVKKGSDGLDDALSTSGILVGDLLLYGDKAGVSGERRVEKALDLLLAPERREMYEAVPVEVTRCSVESG